MSLLTRKEAAAVLRLKPQTLAKWAGTNRNLSVIRIGNRAVRYDQHEINNFIKNCTAASRKVDVILANGAENDE